MGGRDDWGETAAVGIGGDGIAWLMTGSVGLGGLAPVALAAVWLIGGAADW